MSDLPEGVVTFLFTDIEGSTSRWEHEPEAMQAALARHDAILRDAIESHGGIVFKTVGDAFYAVFPQPGDALAAAIDAQRVLQAETWDARLGAIRVRMGVHTGQAERRGPDYFGQPLNRVARLMSSGHGGQILLSAATSALVQATLPEGATLRDLGERRLKDLLRPEHIYQITVVGLPDQFPPLKTLDLRPNNLPIAPTPLVGRDRDLSKVRGMLLTPDVRLVTLLGPGGMGKTRLSLQVAADLSDDFADGLYFIALAAVTEGEFVLSTIAQTLGVHEAPGESLHDALLNYVRDKKLLLVLDNLEQVIEPAAEIVADLLAAGAGVKMLATSRITLKVRGEHEYPVPPLALPDPRHLPPLDALAEYPAIQLFIQRATASKPGFALTPANAPAVAQICAMLDGLPLAIELAAARTKLLPPPALLQKMAPAKSGGISARLRVLTGGARDMPVRHQTLIDTIAFSYDLLTEDEQALHRRLAVFVSGWTYDEAEAIVAAAGDLQLDMLDGLESLVEKSLIRQSEEDDGADVRFNMLQVIREFGLLRLDEANEGTSLRQAHADHFLQFAEEADGNLSGADQATWLNRLETEHDNLRAALAWARDAHESTFGLRLAGMLCRFWQTRGYLTEGRTWIEEFLVLDAGKADPATRARVYFRLGGILVQQGEYAAADQANEQALAIYRQAGDRRGEMQVLNGLGLAALFRGDYARAESIYSESLAIARESNDKAIPTLLLNLGIVVYRQSDFDRAQAYFEESERQARQQKDVRIVGLALGNLGQVAMARQDYSGAVRAYRESLKLAWELGLQFEMATIMEYLAEAMTKLGETQSAARLFGMAEALREEIGAKRPEDERQAYDEATALLHTQLGEADYAAALVAGRAASREQELPALFAGVA